MEKIILAEDDSDTRLFIKQVLSDAGYEVEALDEGSKIGEYKLEPPDLFIIDHQMPTIDGIALTKYLKVHKEFGTSL